MVPEDTSSRGGKPDGSSGDRDGPAGDRNGTTGRTDRRDGSDETAAEGDRTARTVGQLVKYSREVNKADTVGEVGSYALEATFHVMDGTPSPTLFEVGPGGVTVVESMAPGYSPGDEAGPLARRALAGAETVIGTDDVPVEYDAGTVLALDPDELDGAVAAPVSIAAPSVFDEDAGEVGVVLLVQWDDLDAVAAHHVKPVEYLADHLATAVSNVRSHERLERARNDLARRKEMVEMYDRLLRHDLGNDLQVMTGYADALVGQVDDEDDQIAEYAATIERTAGSAADLVERVGDLVGTLEAESEPTIRDLEPVLTESVEGVRAKFEDLTVEYDPADFDVEVYAGDLLDSVFTNILSNAAAHNDGPITVEVYATEPSPDEMVVVFADDGSGVAEDVRDAIFEMGEKGHDSDGNGLGLGFVRTLAESYGGTVALGDSHLGGAEFRVTLERP